MSPIRNERVEEIVAGARKLPSGERLSYVDAACGFDGAIQAEVRRRLAEPAADGTPTDSETVLVATRVTDGGSQTLVGRATFPGYTIVREISRGGQGIVYAAIQHGTKRDVAIKVLRLGSDADLAIRRRFEREIELVALLSHPNIVTVFHAGETEDGLQYCVMDYVRGLPLGRYVRENQLSLEDVLELVGQVCDAVQYAHQRGIIHRDLKPSNILVDLSGAPRILDFGLARFIDDNHSDLTATEQVMGTPQYMAPEQAAGRNRDVDTRTDVYALGVILYELLTGRLPYSTTGGAIEILKHVISAQPSPLVESWHADTGVRRRSTSRRRASRSPFDGDVQTITFKALAKEPERRYQSAGEFANDLRRYLAHEPIEARRDSIWYVLRKLARRNRTAAAVGASVLTILVASSTVAAYFYRERSIALEQRLASDRHLAEQAQEFESIGRSALAMQRPLVFGWFLLEWNEDRNGRARELAGQVPAESPEHAAMTFLLDVERSADEYLASVGPAELALAQFVIAEKLRKSGDVGRALERYNESLRHGLRGWIADAARARIDSLTRTDVQDHPDGSE